MLITFRVSNFLSFNEEVEFSMVAGQVQQPEFHVIKGKKRSEVSLLKTSVVYGANASGKSNLIKAINFVQNVLQKGLKNTLTDSKHFRLDAENISKISKFEVEFKINQVCYAYGFEISLKDKTVKNEWLFEINKNDDKPIFERKVLENGKSNITISHKFDSEGEKRFDVYKKDVKESQFFLSEVNDKDIKDIKNIRPFTDAFHWLTESLVIVYPDTKYGGLNFIGDNKELEEAFCNYLSLFNTGISGIETIELDFDKEFKNLPEQLKLDIINDLSNESEKENTVMIGVRDQLYTIYKNAASEIKIRSLHAKHQLANSDNYEYFKINEESDGTQRLFDIIPILATLSKEKTFIIDELDRSLHPELTKKIIEVFLNNSKSIENQLIVSTHESSLLDLSFLRRDEIWFVEKNLKTGASSLYSLEQYKPRKDKEVRKGYLLGRFGAIPFIADELELGWLNTQKTEEYA